MFNRSQLRLIREDSEPLLDSAYDFSDEKSVLKFRVSRRSLLSIKNILLIAAVVLAIVMSYVAQGWKMDRESADAMRALDLEVAPLYYGKKSINYFGRLVRRDIQVTCSAVADKGQTVDFSERKMCLDNAQLHANCIRVCDSSFSSCGGCDALAADRQNQLDTAISHCDYKSNFVCTLASTPKGGYDYAGLSLCCLGSLPTTAESCLCQYQQSASALCLLNGACLGTGTCRKSSLTCVGISTSQPLPVCSVPGALSCSFSGSTEVDLSCGIAGESQYYLNSATASCVSSCPAGLVNTAIAGVGTCTACTGAGVSTCSSSGTPTSCGVYLGSQYYLTGTTCVTTCPSGSFNSLSGTVGTCTACTGAGVGTGATSCSGSTALTCGAVGSTQYYLTSGACVSSCPTGTAGTIASGNGVCVACPANALTCTAQGQATSCGVTSGTQNYLNPLTSQCVSVCPAGLFNTVISGVGTCKACAGAAITTCSSTTGAATSCGIFQGTQFYLSGINCVTTCPNGSYSSLSGTVGTCAACTGAGLGTGVSSCSGSTVLTCGGVGTTQYYLSSGACVASCPTSTVSSVAGGNGVCVSCPANASTCTRQGQALSCGQSGGITYSLNTITALCVSVCPSGFISASKSGVTGFVCQACSGVGTATCSGLGPALALTCTTSGGVQYYSAGTGICIIGSQCAAGSGTFNSQGLAICNVCADAGALTCSGTGLNSATSCGIAAGNVYLLVSLTNTCITSSVCIGNRNTGTAPALVNGIRVCQACAPHISSCLAGPNQAGSCYLPYYLNAAGTCLSSCTTGQPVCLPSPSNCVCI